MERNSRRSSLKGAAAAVIVSPGFERAPHDASRRAPYSFFTADTAAFIDPAVVHLVPADETGLGRSRPGRLGRVRAPPCKQTGHSQLNFLLCGYMETDDCSPRVAGLRAN
jgi:hypothetical protein